MENEILKAKVVPIKKMYSSENFKIYSFQVKENIVGKVKLNFYSNFTIKGDYHELVIGNEYMADFIYQGEDKYGHQYLASSIYKAKPTNKDEALDFFKGIVNENKLNIISEIYPNFIDMILKNQELDVNKFKGKGIGKKTLERVKNAVINNIGFMEFSIKYSKFGLTPSQIKKIIRKYVTPENFENKMEADIYKTLLDIRGIGFKTADEIALNINPELKKSVSRMTGCIRYYLDDVISKGNTWINDKQLYKVCIEHTPECIEKFGYAIENDLFYYDRVKDRISLMEIYEQEQEICRRLKQLLSKSKSSEIKIDIDKICNGFEFDLTEEQKQAIENVFKYKVSILGGNAGSGKTFSTQVLIKALESQNLSYLLLAPTGKASQQMAIYTDREAKTIHRGLGYNPESGFTYNENNKLPYDVIVIDENSMTDIFLFLSVLKAIDTNNTRLLLIQDFAQIPSISYGNVAYDLVQSGVIPTTRLTKIFRYDKGGLIKVATDTREGKSFVSDLDKSSYTVFGDDKDFMLINSEGDGILKNLVSGYRTLINRGIKPIDILTLTSMNKGNFGTVNINNILQSIANPPSKNLKECSVNGITFRENDLVIQIRNNYHAVAYDGDFKAYIRDIDNDEEQEEQAPEEVFNGNFGTLKEIIEYENRKYFVIEFTGKDVIYEQSDMENVLLGYSITVFKAQGSSANYVFSLLPASHKYMLNRNLMYVAFTRAKIKCYAIGTHSTINQTLRKSAQLSRDTHLKDLLQEI